MLDSFNGGNFSANTATAQTEPTAQYTSFEQAMLQQARMHPQNATRQIAGFGNMKPQFGKRNFIGKNMGGQGFQKRKGPPKPPIDLSKYFCQTCSVSCANPQAYNDHIAGKAHKRKEELAKGNGQPLAKNKSSFQCLLCNVACTGKEAYETHMNGIKHAKAIKNMKLMGKEIPENMTSIIPPSNPLETTMDSNADNGEESLQPIGEAFIEAIDSSGKTTQYHCKLCECTCGDVTAKNLHIRGRRHRLTYKQKVDSSIYVDAKPNARNLKTRKLMREPKIPNFPVNWCLVPQGILSMPPDTAIYDVYDEQHVMTKLDQLRADPKIVEETDILIEMVEKSLKKTSDLLSEKLQSTVVAEEKDMETSEKNRVLRGVIRVGVLGDRLMMKSDRQINAVLLCKDIPTVSLLQSVTGIFMENIENEELRKKTILEVCVEDAGFSIRFNDGEVTCLITLTSIALVADENEIDDDNKVERPKDILPVLPMENSLSSLRHTKFFQSQCWPIQGLCEVVVLLREFFVHNPAWSVFSLHALELIVYKSFVTCPILPRISDAFRRFFEIMASGQFMSPRFKLADPCEKSGFDIFADISRQQRENIMCSAQNTLRLIAFDQIHVILGIDRLNALNRKRPNNLEDEEDNGIKKEKKDG
ncbi:DZF domain-containing protein [Aphelenchoides bicaudatus]|nr:DZF domain-containing protein [Aphelenchoides bicaudatus]